jgi:hypothetical protein
LQRLIAQVVSAEGFVEAACRMVVSENPDEKRRIAVLSETSAA